MRRVTPTADDDTTQGYESPDGIVAGSCAKYDGVNYCISSTSKSLITSFLSIVSLLGFRGGTEVCELLTDFAFSLPSFS